MKNANKKIFEDLKQNLETAYYADYTSNVPQFKLEQLKIAFEDESGISMGYVNYTCGVCQLNFLKQIASWYYNRPAEEPVETKAEEDKAAKKSKKSK